MENHLRPGSDIENEGRSIWGKRDYWSLTFRQGAEKGQRLRYRWGDLHGEGGKGSKADPVNAGRGRKNYSWGKNKEGNKLGSARQAAKRASKHIKRVSEIRKKLGGTEKSTSRGSYC